MLLLQWQLETAKLTKSTDIDFWSSSLKQLIYMYTLDLIVFVKYHSFGHICQSMLFLHVFDMPPIFPLILTYFYKRDDIIYLVA